MLRKTKALVLHSIKYGDTGLIVQVYTQEMGRESLLIQGIRQKKSKVNPYLFQPFALLQLDIYHKPSRSIQRIKDVTCDVPLQRLHFEIVRSSQATFLSEVLLHALREHEPNQALFEFLYHAVQVLDVANEQVENYHLMFLVQLSKFLGIFPANHDDLKAYRVAYTLQMPDLFPYSLSDSVALQISEANRAALLDQLVAYYRDHLPGFGQLKSLSVLRDVFM